jgi:predicted O-linked N-acetylglucosamine transferase (SPINDLY family)
MNRALRRQQKKLAKKGGISSGTAQSIEALQAGLQRHQNGDLAGAEQFYKQVLQLEPEHPEANHLMGTLAHQLGRNDLAIAFLERAVQFSPKNANFHNVLGSALRADGQLDSAIEAHKKAVSIDPKMAAAHNSLAIALKENEDLEGALASAQEAIRLAPNLTEAYNNLGNILSAMEKREEAIEAYELGLNRDPNFLMLRYNYARELQNLGRNDEAAAYYSAVNKDAPDFAEAYTNYGQVLRNLGRPTEAIAILQKAAELAPDVAENYYNLGLALASVGQNIEAIACYEGAYTIKPDYAFAYNDHGNAVLALGRAGDAIPSFKKAIELAPEYAGIHNNLGHAYIRHGDLDAAKEAISKALSINPNYARAYNNMGVIHQEFGEFDQAHAMFTHALKIDPDYKEANSNLLFTMNYDPDKSGEEIFAHYQEFSRALSAKVAATPKAYTNTPDPDKRIKVGYVAPTFYHHAVSYHMLPLFDNCTHDRFEVFAYADIEKVDQYTEQYKSNCDHFFQTKGLSDEQLAEKIRHDQIDILVDIAGHTRNNRLPLFAMRPAPVALHWLDFGYTTGMPEIDYYLGDHNVTPEDQDHLFGEKQVWRLDGPSVAYRPGPGMGEVSELPALKNGYVTFGTLSRTVRLNDKTIRTWSEILKRVPGSKLRFDSRNFTSQSMCNRIAEKFKNHGIERDRLIMGFQSPPWDVLREIDIALDCFPHNSGTTLFEHLFMGNPFITLYNRASVGTLGGAILRGGGFGDWVAHTEEQYVEIATNLASDLDQLSNIRSGMRAKMQASPLMDEKGFVSRVENAYRQMWQKWCESQ